MTFLNKFFIIILHTLQDSGTFRNFDLQLLSSSCVNKATKVRERSWRWEAKLMRISIYIACCVFKILAVNYFHVDI